MKKTLLYPAIILLFTIFILTACATSHTHTYGNWQSSEAGHYLEYTCGCEAPEKPESHIDGDDDGVCDACGYRIKPELKKFSGITLPDLSVVFNGEYHSIYLVGAPEFASVSYIGNAQREVGRYTVRARVEAEGYEPLELSATLTIKAPVYEFYDIEFKSRTVEYTGNALRLEIAGELPEGAKVTYTSVSHPGMTNVFTEPGEYRVKAVVECEYYKTLTLYATLTINEKSPVSVDTAKAPLDIGHSLTYDELCDALLSHNFTLELSIGAEQVYPDGHTESVVYSRVYIGSADGLFYRYTDVFEESEWITDTVEYAVIIGDEAIIATLTKGEEKARYTKIPEKAFYETFAVPYSIAPFTYLEKGEDGGFTPSSVKQYYREFGEFSIDAEKDSFTLKTYNLITHPEFTNSEVVYYTFSSIGNTVVNPDFSLFSDIDTAEVEPQSFTYLGVEYNLNGDEWAADINISVFDIAYLGRGARTVYAEFFDMPVKTVFLPYYVYNNDYEGCEYNVYFDEDLIYLGEYEKYGEVSTNYGTSRYEPISYITEHGGKFNFYGSFEE